MKLRTFPHLPTIAFLPHSLTLPCLCHYGMSTSSSRIITSGGVGKLSQFDAVELRSPQKPRYFDRFVSTASFEAPFRCKMTSHGQPIAIRERDIPSIQAPVKQKRKQKSLSRLLLPRAATSQCKRKQAGASPRESPEEQLLRKPLAQFKKTFDSP